MSIAAHHSVVSTFALSTPSAASAIQPASFAAGATRESASTAEAFCEAFQIKMGHARDGVKPDGTAMAQRADATGGLLPIAANFCCAAESGASKCSITFGVTSNA